MSRREREYRGRYFEKRNNESGRRDGESLRKNERKREP